jgi:predicted DNA-binding protein with PD1-like motif
MAERVEGAPARGGRVIVGRLHPGADLIRGLEAACDEHGVRFASIVACYGSLAGAAYEFLQVPEGEPRARLTGVRVDEQVEFMGGQGLICEAPDGSRATHLHGSVSDATGAVSGGHFVAGGNPVYNNMDFVIQELLGVRLVRSFEAATGAPKMHVSAA